MEIRDATPDDAVAACDVLRRSISELCIADHGNDPAILAAWLRNKTPEIVAGWATQPGNSLLVAVEGKDILAVGSVTDTGEITCNYVSPDARFRGVSRALELCGNLGDAARSGGVVCRRFEDLDAVFESDTCDNLRQVICAFQPPPGF